MLPIRADPQFRPEEGQHSHHSELVKVKPNLTDVVSLPLDEVDAGAGLAVGSGEAGVLQLGDVGGDDSPARDEPHHAAGPEPTGTATLWLATLEGKDDGRSDIFNQAMTHKNIKHHKCEIMIHIVRKLLKP